MEPSATATPAVIDPPAALVDLDRYPLDDLTNPTAQTVIAAARAQLADMGACEHPGFLRQPALETVVADARGLTPLAYRSTGAGTAYLEVPDFSLPDDHPRRYIGEYAVGVIAYDQFPVTSPLRRLYEWDPFMRFVGAVLQRGRLHRYADPLGALNLAVMTDGDQLQWHFDQTDFVVSLAIQDAEDGGDFEVAPRIRSADDEHYAAVQRLFQGHRDAVVRLPMTPGTLLIFEGRYSVHRVSPIRGTIPRLVALFAYDTQPGTTSTEVLRLSRYGRIG